MKIEKDDLVFLRVSRGEGFQDRLGFVGELLPDGRFGVKTQRGVIELEEGQLFLLVKNCASTVDPLEALNKNLSEAFINFVQFVDDTFERYRPTP